MFSPYYAHARRRAGAIGADPANHCALNVALYRRAGGGFWSMTERGRGALRRDARSLAIGPSALQWDADGALCLDIDEVAVPWPARLRGRVRLVPAARHATAYALDDGALHAWCPIAPVARVEVEMSRPALRWHGAGYLDMNTGDAPLEQHFRRWTWSRAMLPGARCAVFYDVVPCHGAARSIALRFDAQGGVETVEAPPLAELPPTGWRVARTTRSDPAHTATVLRTLEDGPFYARSLVAARLGGIDVEAFHESLSMDRFAQRWVQALLPFRMPRRAR